MSRSWEELVAQGRHLVEELTSDKFALGDLIQDAASLRAGQGRRTDLQPSDDVVPKSPDVGIAEFAEAIGLSYRQAVRYRQTAAAWPNHQRRFDVSFGVYFELASRDDRFDVIHDGMTVDEARQVKGNKPKNELAPKTAREKRETFKELARDPDVIDDEDTVAEIARDPGVRRQVQEQTTSDAREGNARTIESDENLRGAVEEGADAAVLESLHRALTSIRRAARLSSSLETTARQREVYADLLNQLSEEIEIARFNLDVAEATSVGGGQR